jgi:fatty acid synthase, animal type
VANQKFEEMSGDDIVISGVAGRFPNARNVEVLAENLYNGVDMVDTENVRFQRSTDAKTLRMGNIADDSKFDAQFFGIRFQLVQNMDPQGRMLIEHSFEAAIDAGWSPKSLRGAKIGVFVGSGTSEYENTWCFERIGPGGFGITG